VEPRSEWVRQMSALVVTSPGIREEVPAAQLLVSRLRNLAGAVVQSCVESACAEGCVCELVDVPGGREACALAWHLTSVEMRAARRTVSDRGAVVAAYLQAVVDAAGAVRLCRRVEHPSGHCWFDADDEPIHVCGEVLAVAHRLGG
jgi:hypothetical protein